MLKVLAPGDVVTVTRIDRLARSIFDYSASSSAPWTRRRNPDHSPSLGPTPAPAPGALMLAGLGGLADVERGLSRTRTTEGRSRAKVRGQQMGRPPALSPAQQKEATRRRAEGATLDELARSYNVGISTIRRATHA